MGKICNLKLIVDKLDKFTSMFLDFRETSNEFTSFMNKIAIDGVQYKKYDCRLEGINNSLQIRKQKRRLDN